MFLGRYLGVLLGAYTRGRTQQSFIREGSALRSNRLRCTILDRKVTPFVELCIPFNRCKRAVFKI